ncbi:hypothetical protein CCHR01_14088 [Colletotrichum chrysophilum]|uniref:Uncharacterized protein n=1 Tax=Colletotrichum chrysophilum TaxID=1836956 RepID=A0AAD9A9A3_9PEZI|nr:hypothetical protein CCHR01_14088 [Colletotrichum chrysophilum]
MSAWCSVWRLDKAEIFSCPEWRPASIKHDAPLHRLMGNLLLFGSRLAPRLSPRIP